MPLAGKQPQFYDPGALQKELDRVFDICHGCRRCFNLCNSFPTLFDLIDGSKTGRDSTASTRQDFGKVVDQCYLCDMCYMTKCPYVPPHPWNVDFPHLMLRAKAVKNRSGATRLARQGTEFDGHGRQTRGHPRRRRDRQRGQSQLRGAQDPGRRARRAPGWPGAAVPIQYPAQATRQAPQAGAAPRRRRRRRERTRGKVALFATCYGNRNEPEIGLDLAGVFEHNGIEVALVERENCCGMPKLEFGDLQAVADSKAKNCRSCSR